jgi:hypothetical protein
MPLFMLHSWVLVDRAVQLVIAQQRGNPSFAGALTERDGGVREAGFDP